MTLFLSLLPLVLLVVLMAAPGPRPWLPQPAARALPAMALLAYVLQWTWFQAGHPPGAPQAGPEEPALHQFIHAAVLDGLLSMATPLGIVFGAMLLFKTLETSGAMAVLVGALRRLTVDPLAQCMLIGWSFSYLVEGLSGFGTPAALAAPVLAGLLGQRVSLVRVAAMCLVMNSVPVSFGAVGTPTWFGLGDLGLSVAQVGRVSLVSVALHSLAAPLVAVMALRIVLPWEGVRGGLGYVLAVVLSGQAAAGAAALASAEFPSIAGGLASLVVAGVLARRGWGLGDRAGGAMLEDESGRGGQSGGLGLARAAFPIVAVVALLAITRIEPLGIKGLLNAERPALEWSLGAAGVVWASPSLVVGWRGLLGTEMSWKMAVLYVPFLVPFVAVSLASIAVLRMDRGMVREAWVSSAGRLAGPAVALAGALVLVKLMMLGNLLSPAMILGRSLGEAAGGLWPLFAPLLGALGSFFSGSNTVSNLTFGPIQKAIAESQGLDVGLVLALQSVGGALGNMVCIHNIVAVAAILGLREGGAAGREKGGVADVLRLTFPPMVAYAALAGLAGWLLATAIRPA